MKKVYWSTKIINQLKSLKGLEKHQTNTRVIRRRRECQFYAHFDETQSYKGERNASLNQATFQVFPNGLRWRRLSLYTLVKLLLYWKA